MENIYFYRVNDFIKIGYTNDTTKRITQICRSGHTTVPEGLKNALLDQGELVACEPGGKNRESRLHAVFAEYRDSGEWFRYSEPIDTYVNAINSGVSGLSIYDDGSQMLAEIVEITKRSKEPNIKNRRELFRKRAEMIAEARRQGLTTRAMADALGVKTQQIVDISKKGGYVHIFYYRRGSA